MSDKQGIYQLTLHVSGVETVTGNSGDFGFPCRDAIFSLDVTAFGGTTPTLDVTIEEKDPVSGTYTTLAQFSFAQVAGATAFERKLADLQTSLQNGTYGAVLRAVWTIAGGGGETYTFSLGAQGKAIA